LTDSPIPSTAFADAWIQIDRTENPRFYVNLLDATRARLMECARTGTRLERPKTHLNGFLGTVT
jgi:hypothetical protein